MQMMDTLALIASISSAFVDTPHVPREGLVYQESWETGTLIRNLAAVDDRPTDAFIELHLDSLAAFTPEGLRHVLPYYLRYSLTHPESDSGVTVRDNLLFHLAPTDPDTEYWRARLAAFSPAQKQALCAYFRYLQTRLAGQDFYSEYLARSLDVWGCS